MSRVRVVQLTKAYDRASFDCGNDYYNGFLQKTALQNARQKTSVTWIAVQEESTAILGYVTLSMGKVEFEHVDESITKKLPKHPIPVLHVGKLAVDQRYQGKQVGALLLRFAAEQAVLLSKRVGCFAIELQADHEDLVAFYLRNGFRQLKPGSLRLYQSVVNIEKAMSDLLVSDPRPEEEV